MKFETQKIESEWFRLHPTVQQIAKEADVYLANVGSELFVTCIFRTSNENDFLYGGHGDHLYGPHVFYHALDARSRDLPSTVKEDLVDFINSRWVYDGRRPAMLVALLEGSSAVGSTGEHFHFQALPAATLPKTLPKVSVDDPSSQA